MTQGKTCGTCKLYEPSEKSEGVFGNCGWRKTLVKRPKWFEWASCQHDFVAAHWGSECETYESKDKTE